jgi:hypothetical protein
VPGIFKIDHDQIVDVRVPAAFVRGVNTSVKGSCAISSDEDGPRIFDGKDESGYFFWRKGQWQ